MSAPNLYGFVRVTNQATGRKWFISLSKFEGACEIRDMGIEGLSLCFEDTETIVDIEETIEEFQELYARAQHDFSRGFIFHEEQTPASTHVDVVELANSIPDITPYCFKNDVLWSAGKNPISVLNEYSQKQGWKSPDYWTEDTVDGYWKVTVEVASMSAQSIRSSKSSAKKACAMKLLHQLKYQETHTED